MSDGCTWEVQEMDTRRTSMRIDEDTQERLDWLAHHYGIGMAAIIRIAVRTLWRRETGLESLDAQMGTTTRGER